MKEFVTEHPALIILIFSMMSGLVVILASLLYKLGIQSLKRMEKSIRELGLSLSRHMSDSAHNIHMLEIELHNYKHESDIRFQRVEMVCANQHGVTFNKRVNDKKKE